MLPKSLPFRCLLLFLLHFNTDICAIEDIPGLHYFETIKDVFMTSRVKRSLRGDNATFQHVDFHAFNRSYHIVLKPGTDVLTEDFEAKIMNADGSASRFHVNVNRFFSGHLVDAPDILVYGHMEENMISLTIYDRDDLFTLEPARIYRKNIEWKPSDNTWIMYKLSDTDLPGHSMYRLDSQSTHVCGNDMLNVTQNVEDHDESNSDNTTWKGKRSLGDRNTCTILIVATYDLYLKRCAGSYYTCAALMYYVKLQCWNWLHVKAQVIPSTNTQTQNPSKEWTLPASAPKPDVSQPTTTESLDSSVYSKKISTVEYGDKVFRSTNFKGISTVRLQISEIIIYTTPTSAKKLYKGRHIHFNADLPIWKYGKLLDSFVSLVKRPKIRQCVSYLVNAHIINDNILGLAYIGHTCSWTNAAFMTYFTSDGIPITAPRSRVLFTHGHLFGSNHDPHSSECFPSSNKGGAYIMWPVILSGRSPNCKKFSPCSRRSIASYLKKRYARTCFTAYAEKKSLCGNGLVEEGEECDEGLKTSTNGSCCTVDCKLVGDAICSDHNSHCCVKCQVAPPGVVCRPKMEGMCLEESYCRYCSWEETRCQIGIVYRGDSLDCPISLPNNDGEPCRNHGECMEGKCRDFCHVHGNKTGNELRSCACEQDRITACKLCCFEDTYSDDPGACIPRSNIVLADNQPCYMGTCQKGVCQPTKMSRRNFINWLKGFDISTGAQIMRNNVVMVVILLSLLFWVPVSCFIAYLDRKIEETEVQEYENDKSVSEMKYENVDSNYSLSKQEFVAVNIPATSKSSLSPKDDENSKAKLSDGLVTDDKSEHEETPIHEFKSVPHIQQSLVISPSKGQTEN